MFLSKRNNGIYYFYYTKNGKRYAVSTKAKTKSDANKFISNFRQKVDEPEKIKLKDFKFRFLKYSEQNHTPSTHQSVKVIFNEFYRRLGNIDISDINKLKASDYLTMKLKVSPYIAQKHLAHLRKAFNYAEEMDLIESNPFKSIKNFQLPEKQPTFFTNDEFEKLIKSVESDDLKDIITFAVFTGLRRTELINLEWNQVSIQGRYIILNNHNDTTKSKKSRIIPLNKSAMNILQNRMTGNKYVFTYVGQKIKADFLTKKFKKIVRKSKVNPRLSFHSLRHTFATRLVQNGVSLYHVSKLMGHADISTTQIYAHLQTDDLRKVVSTLDG